MTSRTSRSTGAVLGGALASGALLVLLAGVPGARGDEQPPGYSPFAGGQTYKTYCMNCHGVDGHGDGYIADSLKQAPSDLTRLAERNGGEYPAERVGRVIDGRDEVRLHGSREMPIWGDALLWPEGESPERRAHVERRIGELVVFLETLQAKPEAAAPAP
ncbi:MAG: cytochrome c [Thermoanaerobaculia bacterium]|nr:MAG: cytochrome c [Thermoanaerobaculia bacterium]MBZ0101244.1 cytochrome c [Thermoanaerobaculia bacterium]